MDAYLNSCGLVVTEGYCQQIPEQVEQLISIVRKHNVLSVLEIGFNAGHSAEIFLQNNPNIELVSFDLGCHPYVLPAKKYIDEKYPDSHTLILGNSLETLPKYISENPDKKFDVLFIDGGHDYHYAHGDLQNCEKLAHSESIVIMDDTCYKSEWMQNHTQGPTQVWTSAINDGRIIQLGSQDYSVGRGMSWGKFKMAIGLNNYL